MSKKLSDSFFIRNTRIPNRICLPPMVIFGLSDDAGMVTDQNVAHYRTLAKGGVGLLIQEATCVTKEGRLSADQLGIWSDEQVEGLSRIAAAVHAEGKPIIMQIHHAGVVGINTAPMCPSDYTVTFKKQEKAGRAMTAGEVEDVISAFISAGRRAFEAGYDGVELHGCHNYLICQFMNSRVNRREDNYADPMEFVKKIIDGIRECTSDDFIIGIRLGCFEPTLADGIAHAKALEQAGIDFIDVSYGFDKESEPECPEGFPHKDVIYAAGEIKKNVNVPVFAVNGICTPEDAAAILADTDVDMVDIGRSMLVDPEWANKALAGQTPGKCLHCRPCAKFAPDGRCAGKMLMERGAGKN